LKIYIASFFDTRTRLRPYRDQLWSLGHEVVSSWLDETAKPAGMSHDDFWRKLAMKDVAEVKSADLLIVDTMDVTPRGGREVELGVALASFQQKQVFIVGPVRNVFHQLADRRFDSWDDCMVHVKGIESTPLPESGGAAQPT
jgi:nucleoside 2-deoxyribosyltransferase